MPDRSPAPSALRLAWYVAIAPLAGALTFVALFYVYGRALLPAWAADAATVACGAVGLLAGGIAAATVPPAPVVAPSAGRRPVAALQFLAPVTAVAAVLLVGAPALVVDSVLIRLGLAAAVGIVVLKVLPRR